MNFPVRGMVSERDGRETVLTSNLLIRPINRNSRPQHHAPQRHQSLKESPLQIQSTCLVRDVASSGELGSIFLRTTDEAPPLQRLNSSSWNYIGLCCAPPKARCSPSFASDIKCKKSVFSCLKRVAINRAETVSHNRSINGCLLNSFLKNSINCMHFWISLLCTLSLWNHCYSGKIWRLLFLKALQIVFCFSS